MSSKLNRQKTRSATPISVGTTKLIFILQIMFILSKIDFTKGIEHVAQPFAGFHRLVSARMH